MTLTSHHQSATTLPTRACTVVVLMLHGDCNMHCTFCINDAGMQCMTWEDALEGLDWAHAWGARTVVLGGGEPFTWPHDVVRLAQVAKERGFLVQVGTNALHLPDNWEALPWFDRWVLPIESAEARSHDRMRLTAGSHHEVIRARLETLGRAGRSVTLSTVVTATNVEVLDSLADWILEYHARWGNVHAWHLYRFIPHGYGIRHADTLLLPDADYQAIVDRIKSRGLPFQVFRRSDMSRSRTVEFLARRAGRLTWGEDAWGATAPRRESSCATQPMGICRP